MADNEASALIRYNEITQCQHLSCMHLDQHNRQQIAILHSAVAEYKWKEACDRNKDIQIRTLEVKLLSKDDEIQTLHDRLASTNQQLVIGNHKYQQIHHSNEELQTANRDLEALVHQKDNEKTLLQAELSEAKDATHDMEVGKGAEIHLLKNELAMAEERIEDLESSKKHDVDQLTNHLAETERKAERVASEHDQQDQKLKNELRHLQTRNADLADALEETRRLKDGKVEEVNRLQSSLARAEQRACELKSENCEKIEGLKIDLAAQAQSTRVMVNSKNDEIRQLQSRVDKASAEITSLEEAREKIDAANNRAVQQAKEDAVAQHGQWVAHATMKPEVTSGLEQLLQNAQSLLPLVRAEDDRLRLAPIDKHRMLEALDHAFHEIGQDREQSRPKEDEKGEKEGSVMSRTRSDSTITVELPRDTAALAATKTFSTDTATKARVIEPRSPLEENGHAQKPSSSAVTSPKAKVDSTLPPAGPSASRRRSADDSVNRSPKKKQKVDHSSLGSIVRTLEQPDSYKDPRRAQNKGLASRTTAPRSR